mmetsp:Transcript_134853/g.234425  ORF Transcript_134853/g.234425 Transcript_134853/m.234425 type:complete len:325 (+) Transcript_134853:110-1084(+)
MTGNPLEGFQHPVAVGFLLGFIMIGPDHLGTLMALSTLTSGIQSFKVGISWGLGHSIGMVLLVPPFMLLERFSTNALNVTVEQWEYFGDYFIGASMIAVAIYFWAYESRYLKRKTDGTYAVESCSCHPVYETQAGLWSEQSHSSNDGKDDAATCQPCLLHETEPISLHQAKMEATPLLEDKAAAASRANSWFSADTQDWRNAFLGLFQGLCCPMALMGLGFMGKMSGSAMPSVFVFVTAFMFASALGSGFLTFAWGMLSSHGLTSCISPLIVYRVVNYLTFSLGVIWIAANASGVLHYLNHMTGMHSEVPASTHEDIHSMHGGF